MSVSEPPVHILLLVEDNPADADLVRELLEQAGEPFRVELVGKVSEATRRLRSEHVDVVLLDLHLPDASGVQTVQAVRAIAEEVPIVVLTGTDDRDLAISCIDAGAQDYLCKGEIRPTSLSRSIGYAITRIRETQQRELQDTLTRFRTLSSTTTGTSVTGAIAGTGAVRRRYPNAFQELVRDYTNMLEEYLGQLTSRRSKPREEMERVVTRLGDAGAGPRDLMDVHIAALDTTAIASSGERARLLAVEGRLLALEMMGMLVDYYRVGIRRSFSGNRS
jgi:DNA-binding NarL/FixJ family response regulator